ncbi:MAG: Hsp33 family molecular chaperone HslO [Deltaproteobacteria bacterium]|nr:MAG: Hsp33 family molecular chaperone HslO [Deltaproteobacteria bacterium]
MSLGSKIAWDDTILPFQLDKSNVRGRVVRLDSALDAILSQHDYPAPIEALVAEASILTALIGPAIKLRWKLSLQVRGKGPARLIATDYFAPRQEGEPAHVRAYASFDRERLQPDKDAFSQIGEGYFAILIDQGPGTEPYSGLTPIAGNALADCAQTYFEQSEQLPTRFALTAEREADGWRAGGVMIQKLPATGGASGPAGASKDDDLADWQRVNARLEMVRSDELVGPNIHPTDMLIRLFEAEQPRVFDPHPVHFGCTCSEAKVRQTLSIYSRKDISRMTTEAGVVTADCQFCGAHYELAPETLGFEATEGPGDGR